MNKIVKIKNKIYVGIVVLALVMLVSGASILAVAAPATTSDPLITLGYLNGPFRTAVNAHVAAQVTAVTNTFNARADQLQAQINTSLTSNQASTFVLRTLNNGQALAIPNGAEAMLRNGSANITAGPLINSTTGTEQSSGAMARNNMYISAGAGSITATANGTTVLIRGVAGMAPMAADLGGLDLGDLDLGLFNIEEEHPPEDLPEETPDDLPDEDDE